MSVTPLASSDGLLFCRTPTTKLFMLRTSNSNTVCILSKRTLSQLLLLNQILVCNSWHVFGQQPKSLNSSIVKDKKNNKNNYHESRKKENGLDKPERNQATTNGSQNTTYSLSKNHYWNPQRITEQDITYAAAEKWPVTTVRSYNFCKIVVTIRCRFFDPSPPKFCFWQKTLQIPTITVVQKPPNLPIKYAQLQLSNHLGFVPCCISFNS